MEKRNQHFYRVYVCFFLIEFRREISDQLLLLFGTVFYFQDLIKEFIEFYNDFSNFYIYNIYMYKVKVKNILWFDRYISKSKKIYKLNHVCFQYKMVTAHGLMLVVYFTHEFHIQNRIMKLEYNSPIHNTQMIYLSICTLMFSVIR